MEDLDKQFGFELEDTTEQSEDDGFGFQPDLSESESAALKNYISTPGISEEESFMRGVEQGPAFGFADEVGGAIGASIEAASQIPEKGLGAISDQNLKNLYNEYLDFNRKRYKAAEEAHPYLYTGGAVAGGFLLPGATFGRLGKVGEAANIGEKFAKGAALGGITGGISAAGTSEAPVMSGEFAQDVGTGIGFGTALGGGIPLAVGTAKAVYEGTKSLASPIMKGLKQGLKGVNLVGDEAEKQIQSNIAKYGKNLSQDIINELNSLGKLKTQLVNEAEEAGVKIDATKLDDMINKRLGDDPATNLPEARREIEQFREMLRTAKEGKLVRRQKQTQLPTGKEKMRQVQELKVAEQSAIESGIDPNDIETIFEPVDVPGQVAAVVRQVVRDAEGQPKGFKKLASRLIQEDEIPQFRTKTETVRAGGADLQRPEEMYQLYKDLKQKSTYGDYSFKSQEATKATSGTMRDVQGLLREAVPGLEQTDAKIASLKRGASLIGMDDTIDYDPQQLMNRVVDLINRQEQVGGTGGKARQQLADFVEAIKDQHPELAERVSMQIKDLGEQAIASKDIAGIVQAGIVSTPKRFAVAGGNIVGQALYKLGKLPPEALSLKAQQIASKGSKAAQELSRIIGTLPDKSDRERNAILYGLMQNPAYRKWLTEDEPQENQVP